MNSIAASAAGLHLYSLLDLVFTTQPTHCLSHIIVETILSDAIRKPYSVQGETTLLWKANTTVGMYVKPILYSSRYVHAPLYYSRYELTGYTIL